MAAATLNLSVEQGSTFTRKLTFKDENDATIDLTGRTFSGKVRKSIGGAVVANFTFQILNQTTNEGEVYMTLTAADSDAIPVTKQETATRETVDFVYDVEQDFGAGVIERVLQGKLTLSPSVTK